MGDPTSPPRKNQLSLFSPRKAKEILSVQGCSSKHLNQHFQQVGRFLLNNPKSRQYSESLEMLHGGLEGSLKTAQERNKKPILLKLPLDVEEGFFNDEMQQNEAIQLTNQENCVRC
ncbi:hypothetical protein Tco_0658221 [Tanacetum coccineum]